MSEPTSGNPGDLPPPAANADLTGDAVPGAVPPAQVGDPVPTGSDAGLPVPYAPNPSLYPFATPPYAGPALPYPVTAAPYPVTGAAYPVTGGYPLAAPPYPYAVAAPPPRRAAVVVLAIATAVLLLGAGALGALWFFDHDQAAQTSADQQAQIDELRDQVAQLEDDLEETETQLQRAEDDLLDAQACPAAVQAFVDLANEFESAGEGEIPAAQIERVATEMVIACNAAP